MARIKRGINVKRKHKKVLKQARGYYGAKHRLYRSDCHTRRKDTFDPIF